MKKVLALVTTLALVGAICLSPAKDQKDQPKQLTKSVQENIQLMYDPGTGMG